MDTQTVTQTARADLGKQAAVGKSDERSEATGERSGEGLTARQGYDSTVQVLQGLGSRSSAYKGGEPL
jgi:hypothetical protein